MLSSNALHDIARDSCICGLSDARRVDIIRVFDGRAAFLGKWANKRVKSVLDRLLFPDMLRAWVELFVSDKSIAEHYVQVILRVLYPSFTYRRKRSVVPRKIELLMVK